MRADGEDLASSGNLLADRRYGYARALYDEGEWEAASDLAAQALELAPGFAPAWFLIGEARERQAEADPDAGRRRDEAIHAFERALALDPEDRLGAALRLAILGVGDPQAAMAPAYIRRLFDDYAPRFERQLVEGLNYRAPELLVAALRRVTGPHVGGFRIGTVLDLGCGTGLMAGALAGAAERIEGVDLSPRMLREAARTGLYARLDQGDLLEHLRERPDAAFDLVLAADVFVYLADLAPVFGQAWRVLRPAGLFAFTVQAGEGEGATLGADQRYAHSEPYLRRLAAETGFQVAVLDAVSTRRDRGLDVPGFLAVLRRPGRA